MASDAELAACEQTVADLTVQNAYLTVDVSAAIQAGIDSALAASTLEACQEAIRVGIQPACDTLKRGGA